MHSAGVAHRDLKPENIMLNKEYTLKIADFGFGAPIEGRDKSGLLTSVLGTESYMAPEIHLHKPYTGAGVDLFAAGIILFIMISQRPPFNKADIQDPHYRLIAGGRHELFWQAHEQVNTEENPFTPEFKDLFNQMMALNPNQRPSIDNILAHPFVRGDTASKAEVQAEFKRRKESVDEEVAKEAEERKTERAKKTKNDIARGIEDENLVAQLEELNQEREMLEFDDEMRKTTQFFSSSTPEQIFAHLVEKFYKDEHVEFNVSANKWKLKFTMKHGGPAFAIECVCNIFKVKGNKEEDNTICVDFQRNAGDSLNFFREYQKIAEDLQCHNDVVYTE